MVACAGSYVVLDLTEFEGFRDDVIDNDDFL